MLGYLPVRQARHEAVRPAPRPLRRVLRRRGTGLLGRAPNQQPVAARHDIDLIAPDDMFGHRSACWRRQHHDLALDRRHRGNCLRRQALDPRAPSARRKHIGIGCVKRERRTDAGHSVRIGFDAHRGLVRKDCPSTTHESSASARTSALVSTTASFGAHIAPEISSVSIGSIARASTASSRAPPCA